MYKLDATITGLSYRINKCIFLIDFRRVQRLYLPKVYSVFGIVQVVQASQEIRQSVSLIPHKNRDADSRPFHRNIIRLNKTPTTNEWD